MAKHPHRATEAIQAHRPGPPPPAPEPPDAEAAEARALRPGLSIALLIWLAAFFGLFVYMLCDLLIGLIL